MKDLFVNAETGEMIEIETTKESIAEMKALQESQAIEATREATVKAAAEAKLAALGLTAEEIAAISK